MSRRHSVLAAFRRQRERLGRAALVLFALASVTTAAAPCLAMAAAAAEATAAETRLLAPDSAGTLVSGRAGAKASDHAGTHLSGHAGTHLSDHAGTHGHPVPHGHLEKAAHDLTADDLTAHDRAAHESGSRCPHCPLSGGMPGHAPSVTHSLCSAGEDVSDHTPSGSSLPLAKHLLPAAYELLPPLSARAPPRSFVRSTVVHRPAVALNLRHCVFLI